jgi:hypothetical protein
MAGVRSKLTPVFYCLAELSLLAWREKVATTRPDEGCWKE